MHTEKFMGAKFDNDMSTFSVDNTNEKLLVFQNQLGCMHSYSSPHSNWKILWLDWKTLFVKLHTDTFLSAKFDNDMSTFFEDTPDLKLPVFQNKQGLINS